MDDEQLRAAALGAYQAGPEAVVALVQQVVGEFRHQVETLTARVSVLEAENAALRAEVRHLRARLAKDSHNSHLPPSSDGPGGPSAPVRVPKSLRERGGRRPGAQPGHPGHTRQLVAEPDLVQVHQPASCTGCGHDLTDAPVVSTERRQVVDLPVVRAHVTEHRAQTRRCPGCGRANAATFPVGVDGALQYGPGMAALAVYLHQEQLVPVERTGRILGELFGYRIGGGTLERMVARCAEAVGEVVAAIKQAVIAAPIVHVDETGLSLGRSRAWLHVGSTRALTYYGVHPRRGQVGIDAVGLVPLARGTLVHDGWRPYWRYPRCAHALCNAHHLRELTFVQEKCEQAWAGQLAALLREIKRAADRARAAGATALGAAEQAAWTTRYRALVAEGTRLNPSGPPRGGKRGRPRRSAAGNLAQRLQQYDDATLAFMRDLRVPFENNQAERDLRMMKVRQKISGCFRTQRGADQFCRMRSYLSTLRKQGSPILAALTNAMRGTPLVPALA